MPNTSLVNVRLLSGGYEVSSDHNAGKLTRYRDAKDASTFGLNNRDRVYRPGLKRMDLGLQGYFVGDGVNAVHQAQYVSAVPDVLTVIAPDGLEGATAYSCENVMTELSDFGGAIGDMAAFSVTAVGTGDNFRGRVLEDGTTDRSSSGTGSNVQLTDVGAGETMRAALHVIERTGTANVTARIESDDSGAFGTPTTRLTFAEATGVVGEFITDETVVADDFWRAAWAITGTGTVKFVVTFGIA